MTAEEVAHCLSQLASMWPKSMLTEGQQHGWKVFLSPHEYRIAEQAIDKHFTISKFAPKPADIALIMKVIREKYARGPVADSPAEPENFVAILRRQHKIPRETTDEDVLIWYHQAENARAHEVYGAKDYPKQLKRLRANFRRDWLRCGCPVEGGHEAEGRCFANNEEVERFWTKQAVPA